jgi:hypothetical protein
MSLNELFKANEFHPICPLKARTLWVIHTTSPSQQLTR